MRQLSLLALAVSLTLCICFVASGAVDPFVNTGNKLTLIKCDVTKAKLDADAEVAKHQAALTNDPATTDVTNKKKLLEGKVQHYIDEIANLDTTDSKYAGKLKGAQIALGKQQTELATFLAASATKTVLQNKLNLKVAQDDVARLVDPVTLVANLKKSKQPWTIHGLWPDNTNANTPSIKPANAPVMVPPGLDADWIDCTGKLGHAGFRKHEWTKHGLNTGGNGGQGKIYKGEHAEELYYKHAMDLLGKARVLCDQAAKAADGRATKPGLGVVAWIAPTTDCVVELDWAKASQMWKTKK